MDGLTVLTWRVPRASAADLEAATLPEADRDALLSELRDAAGAKELAYVPTCQRVVLTLLHAPDDVARRVHAFYADRLRRELPAAETFDGFEAFAHLAEAASSLDSLVVGEPQVLGQFKAAAARADESALAAAGLRHVHSLVFRAAKAVRHETALFKGKVSLVPLTEALLASHLLGVAQPRVAVVGTGQIGEKMVELVRAQHPGADLHVVSRSPERAHEVAAMHDATGHTLKAFLERPPRGLDVLALALGVDAPFVPAAWMAERAAEKPLLVLDLAIPRNAEHVEGDVAGLRLVQMDDLSRMSEAAKAGREAEVATAQAVLARELGVIQVEYEQRKLAHDLALLSQRFQEVAADRLARAREAGLEVDAKWFDQTVRALLHEATGAVKRAGCPPGGRAGGKGRGE